MRACKCGKVVQLRALRITLNRHRGVSHWIEHADEGNYTSTAMKPYPKQDADKPWKQLIARWEGVKP